MTPLDPEAAPSEAAAGDRTSETPSSPTRAPPVTTCSFCSEQFPTRSAMFRHLERPCATCPAPREDYGEKVLLVVGYDSRLMAGKGDEGAVTPTTSDMPARPVGTSSGTAVVGGASAANFVLKAMGIEVEKRRDASGEGGSSSQQQSYCSRPGGFSQASSVGSRTCPLLAQEEEVSATADTICLKAPTTVPLEGIRKWLDDTNAALDNSDGNARGAIRLLGRMAVPSTFHAEIHAKRRRYEYLLPAWMLDETAEGPWEGPPRGQENLIPLLRRLRARGLRPFGHCNGEHDGTRRRCPLWHNFSASALPHSPSSLRRLYRFYAMEVIQSSSSSSQGGDAGAGGMDYVCLSINGDAFMSQQVRGMVALAVAGARGLISAKGIAATIDPTRQEDLLPVPLAPAAPCSLAEVGYSGWQMRLGVGGQGVCMSPGAEQRGCRPLEGWSDEVSRSEGARFRRQVLDSAARWWEERGGGVGWLRDVLQPGAVKLGREVQASDIRAGGLEEDKSSEGRGEEDGCRGRSGPRDESRRGASADGTPLSAEELSSLEEAPALYAKVLGLLREASASGQWPTSTASRSLVIFGERGDRADEVCSSTGRSKQTDLAGCENGCGSDNTAPAEEAPPAMARTVGEEKASTATKPDGQQEQEDRQRGGGSGSFTLGAFPPPCPPPRCNRLFTELARAAFELEAALLPERPPSTTIAVNRNARFKPHVDSGSGAGQSRSLIVGLGDYVRGELVVEGEEADIRYRPLEFNGWTQRHWTRPFSGERYSLVWFTPKGCEGISGDARFSSAADDDAGGGEGGSGDEGGEVRPSR
ncbi:unnamed protein product [Ectocarpus sp. CCAP 1310/34]|nr:unnamed protein product [Ectocarpus sp. CCAP 1310/34]